MPYLPIDPQDVGRTYEAIIRINSQSGKGGIAYILQEDYGINLPRNLQVEFREEIQRITDARGQGNAVQGASMRASSSAMSISPARGCRFVDHHTYPDPRDEGHADAGGGDHGQRRDQAHQGRGTGPIDGFVDALSSYLDMRRFRWPIIPSIRCSTARTPRPSATWKWSSRAARLFGVGINTNIVAASLEAIVSAVEPAAANAGDGGSVISLPPQAISRRWAGGAW